MAGVLWRDVRGQLGRDSVKNNLQREQNVQKTGRRRSDWSLYAGQTEVKVMMDTEKRHVIRQNTISQ